MSVILRGETLIGCLTVRADSIGVAWIENCYLDPACQSRYLAAADSFSPFRAGVCAGRRRALVICSNA